MNMGVLPTYVSVHPTCARDPQKREEGNESPQAGVTDCCEPPCGAGDWAQEELPVLLTTD